MEREREREGGWILNRPSTYRGMKTANGEGSKLKKKREKVAVRLYISSFSGGTVWNFY